MRMNSNAERRRKARFHHEAQVTLENDEIGLLHGVRMYNYSSSGIYFESNFYLQPGTELTIGINSSPLADQANVFECYRAVIKWRKFIEESSFDYGYGLELLELRPRGEKNDPDAPDPGAAKSDSRQEARRHARQECYIPAKVSTPLQTFGVLIDNVSKGGIFFKTHHDLTPGQRLNLMIPLRRKGKLLRKSAKVVWSKDGSVGVQFQPADD